MDYGLLKTEIQKPDYDGLSSFEIANKLNERTCTTFRTISSKELMVWAGQKSRYAKLFDAAISPQTPEAVRSICLSALQLLERSDTVLDLNEPEVAMMFGGLIIAGIFTPEDKVGLEDLVRVYISKAEELLGPGTELYFEHIDKARGS